jgi:hypothetical protein
MNIDSKIVLEAPFVSSIPGPGAAALSVPRKPHVWARDRGESPAVAAATAAVLLLSGLVAMSAFAHVFVS